MAAGPEVVAPKMGEGGVGARCRRGGDGRRHHDDSVREEQSGNKRVPCRDNRRDL
jgi:hypothetical protein